MTNLCQNHKTLNMMLVKKGMVKRQCQSYKGVKILILLPGMHDIFLAKLRRMDCPSKLILCSTLWNPQIMPPNFALDFLEPLKLESRKGKAFPFGII